MSLRLCLCHYISSSLAVCVCVCVCVCIFFLADYLQVAGEWTIQRLLGLKCFYLKGKSISFLLHLAEVLDGGGMGTREVPERGLAFPMHHFR